MTQKDNAASRLLSGGNPQIPKGYGDEPVQAYIAALPGWKREAGAALDALIAKTVPDVQKAVKWNSPLYGIADQGWFLGLHVFNRYIKLAFFRGADLHPPPVASKAGATRYSSTKTKGRTRRSSPTGSPRPAGCRASACERPMIPFRDPTR